MSKHYLMFTFLIFSSLNAQGLDQTPSQTNAASPASLASQESLLEPFTGKITRNKVRMRLQPNLDASILAELNRDDLLSVVSESGEFYAVLPPKDFKAYIFRTYVLDNVVEGNRVNVRLEPALEAPVIAQLNNGDRIEGVISPLNSKWLEITPPVSTRFYVCKEYVEKVGPPAMLAKLEKRRLEVKALFNSAHVISEQELQKEYEEIDLEPAIANLNTILKQYEDFPKFIEQARVLLSTIQESFLHKKIAYLEAKASLADRPANVKSIEDIFDSSEKSKEEILALQTSPQEPAPLPAPSYQTQGKDPFDPASMAGKMTTWIPMEKALYESWQVQHPSGSPQDFYEQQLEDCLTLRGTIESYPRTMRSKPGDYLLVSSTTKLPIAYLYSTKVNLQDIVGKEVTLHASSRPNNHFAFPAYFVLAIEN